MVHLIPFSAAAFLPKPRRGSLGVLNSQDGWNCRFSIADCRLLMDIGGSCHTTFSIVNQQSAMRTKVSTDSRPSTVDSRLAFTRLSACFHATARSYLQPSFGQ
jgi:hypothetical protein